MTQEQHPLNLGKLLVDFHSLEFVLRAFLHETEDDPESRLPQSTHLHELRKGDEVPENAFTNYDTLAILIEKYNSNPKISASASTIDKNIVHIRDAIAHGRVFGRIPSPPFRLLKFSRPKDKRTRVTFSVLLTHEWFNQQLAKVQEAALTVSEALTSLREGKL